MRPRHLAAFLRAAVLAVAARRVLIVARERAAAPAGGHGVIRGGQAVSGGGREAAIGDRRSTASSSSHGAATPKNSTGAPSTAVVADRQRSRAAPGLCTGNLAALRAEVRLQTPRRTPISRRLRVVRRSRVLADACGTRDRVRQFDDLLAREVPRIEASSASAPTARSSSPGTSGSDPPQAPGHVLLAAPGPPVRPGAVDGPRHDHYGLERTLAEGSA